MFKNICITCTQIIESIIRGYTLVAKIFGNNIIIQIQ